MSDSAEHLIVRRYRELYEKTYKTQSTLYGEQILEIIRATSRFYNTEELRLKVMHLLEDTNVRNP